MLQTELAELEEQVGTELGIICSGLQLAETQTYEIAEPLSVREAMRYGDILKHELTNPFKAGSGPLITEILSRHSKLEKDFNAFLLI